jgi:hypothetical protein
MHHHDKQQTLLGIALFALVIVPGLVFGVVKLIKLVDQPASSRDFCSAPQTAAVHAVFIDVSDPLTPRQKVDLNTYLERLISQWGYDERLLVYVLNADVRSLPTPVFSSCRPQLLETEAKTTATESWLQRQAQPFFEKTRIQFQSWLTMASPGAESPIIEYLQAIANTPEFAGATQRRLDIISDLGQNTARYAEGEASRALAGTAVTILKLERPGRRDNPAVIDYLQQVGADVKIDARLI